MQLQPLIIARTAHETILRPDYEKFYNLHGPKPTEGRRYLYDFVLQLFKEAVYVTKIQLSAQEDEPIVDIRIFKGFQQAQGHASQLQRIFYPTELNILTFDGRTFTEVELTKFLLKWSQTLQT